MNGVRTAHLKIDAQVSHGRSAVKALAAIAPAHGDRWLLITARSLAQGGLLPRIEEFLRPARVVKVVTAAEHVPVARLAEIVDEVSDCPIDGLICLGGGSVMDMGKALNSVLSLGLNAAELDEHPADELPARMTGAEASSDVLPIIAIPTTLSGAEFSARFGVTTSRGGKRILRFQRPRHVILDPHFAQDTPPILWSSTGLRAIDHAVETWVAPTAHPPAQATAQEALWLLLGNLVPATERRDDLDSILACQYGMWLASFWIESVRTGLSHAIGHQLGAAWHIPHGITSCLSLVPVMRWNEQRGVDYTPLRAAVRESSSTDLALGIAQLQTRLGLPRTFSDLGRSVNEEQIASLADKILQDPNAGAHPHPVHRQDVLGILSEICG